MARRCLEFLIPVLFLSVGCGSIDDTPDVPVASLIAPSGDLSGEVTVEFTIVDSESRLVNVTIEQGTGGALATATAAATSAALTGLETSPEGVTHTFLWDTMVDIGCEREEAVVIAIKVTAGAVDGIGDSLDALVVDNTVGELCTYTVSGEICAVETPLGTVTGDMAGKLYVSIYVNDSDYIYPPVLIQPLTAVDLGSQDLSDPASCVPYSFVGISPGTYALIGLLDDNNNAIGLGVFSADTGDLTNAGGTNVIVTDADVTTEVTLNYAYDQ